MPIIIRKQKGETQNDLINRFRKASMDENIVEMLRAKTQYIKKSRQRYERNKKTAVLKRKVK